MPQVPFAQAQMQTLHNLDLTNIPSFDSTPDTPQDRTRTLLQANQHIDNPSNLATVLEICGFDREAATRLEADYNETLGSIHDAVYTWKDVLDYVEDQFGMEDLYGL
jgi:hypothetical protein